MNYVNDPTRFPCYVIYIIQGVYFYCCVSSLQQYKQFRNALSIVERYTSFCKCEIKGFSLRKPDLSIFKK